MSNELPPYVSKLDIVTGALRSLIIDGSYAPGTPLRQRELAKRLGVSVTPVREALRRLESEGIVTFDPHVGASVVHVDFGPTVENFRIRASLESLAAAMATANITDDEIAELEKLFERMVESENDTAKLSELNREFHFTIYEYSKSPLLISLIRRLWLSFGGGPVLKDHPDKRQRQRDAEESRHQHEAIIAALRERDEEKAERLVRHHILSGLHRWGANSDQTLSSTSRARSHSATPLP